MGAWRKEVFRMTGFGEPLVADFREERGHEPKIVAKLWKSENVKEFIFKASEMYYNSPELFVASRTTL